MSRDLAEFVDEFGEVRPLDGLDAAIAEAVRQCPRLVNWCDDAGTRLTVLFALPGRVGWIPGFGPLDQVLYVSVEGYGSYGFVVKDQPLHPAYIAEKLGREPQGSPVSVTWERLAELVSGVRQELAR